MRTGVTTTSLRSGLWVLLWIFCLLWTLDDDRRLSTQQLRKRVKSRMSKLDEIQTHCLGERDVERPKPRFPLRILRATNCWGSRCSLPVCVYLIAARRGEAWSAGSAAPLYSPRSALLARSSPAASSSLIAAAVAEEDAAYSFAAADGSIPYDWRADQLRPRPGPVRVGRGRPRERLRRPLRPLLSGGATTAGEFAAPTTCAPERGKAAGRQRGVLLPRVAVLGRREDGVAIPQLEEGASVPRSACLRMRECRTVEGIVWT